MRSRLLFSLLLVSLIISVSSGVVLAETSKFLTQDTWMQPRGDYWGSVGLYFMKNTTVTLDQNNRVITGTLNDNKWLYPPGVAESMGGVTFKAGAPVTFNTNGRVTTGTLYSMSNLRPPGAVWNGSTLQFMGNSVVAFNESGRVVEGVLAALWTLRPRGAIWKSAGSFPHFGQATKVIFDENGDLVTGVLAYDTQLNTAPNAPKRFPANTVVTFDANGYAQ